MQLTEDTCRLPGIQFTHPLQPIETTETENKDTLDAFAEAMIRIAGEAKIQPEILHEAPHTTLFGRMDEIRAARELMLPKVLAAGKLQRRLTRSPSRTRPAIPQPPAAMFAAATITRSTTLPPWLRRSY